MAEAVAKITVMKSLIALRPTREKTGVIDADKTKTMARLSDQTAVRKQVVVLLLEELVDVVRFVTDLVARRRAVRQPLRLVVRREDRPSIDKAQRVRKVSLNPFRVALLVAVPLSVTDQRLSK